MEHWAEGSYSDNSSDYPEGGKDYFAPHSGKKIQDQ